MQIFELHFNPKSKEDRFLDSFIYEPENIYEKNLGNLYMVGDLQNALPQNSKLLDNLSKVIKKNYYNFSFKSPERALTETSKRANEFLAEEVRKENVSWLGNLNFAIFSLKDFNLNFAKTGNLKILLLRARQVINIGKNLDIQEIEPYPLKVFLNIISGKLAQDDIILILTKEIFEFFQEQNLLDKIAQLDSLDGKKLKKALPSQLFTKGDGSKISGICFLAPLKEEAKPRKRQPEKIRFQKEEKFSFSQALAPLSNLSKKIISGFSYLKKPTQFLSKIRRPRKPKTKVPKSQILEKALLKKPNLKKIAKISPAKKSLILISGLTLILLFGLLIFKGVEHRKETKTENNLNEIKEKVLQAENFLIFKNNKEAESLLKEAWLEISALAEKETSLESEILSLKQSIEENLGDLNNLERIENLEIVAELKPEESIIEHKKTLYSFSGSGLFFSPPNTTFILKNGDWQEKTLQLPDSDFNFSQLSSYASHLYFLDVKKYEVIKYPHLKNLEWGEPQAWIKEKGGQQGKAKSIAIDGSIWILEDNNSIARYHKGNYQETINLNIFPFPENIIKIKTSASLPYLYLLEPIKKRIIITDKKGEIVKQFQSEEFNNLKDFEISSDGETIWLLNGLKIYQIQL